jgi:NAD(P)-dependent dehydrogenase (short-subunit alcohol dehydrogenase family)
MGMVRGTKFVDDHPELRELPDTLGPLGELPHADDIAEAVAFLASDRARFVTGEIVNVSGGSYMRN